MSFVIKMTKSPSTYTVGLYRRIKIIWTFDKAISVYRVRKDSLVPDVIGDVVKSWIEINNIKDEDIYIYDWYRKQIEL